MMTKMETTTKSLMKAMKRTDMPSEFSEKRGRSKGAAKTAMGTGMVTQH